jgi:hypothetical protein
MKGLLKELPMKTGTVQDSAADGDIKVIDVLDSNAKVKAEKPGKEGGSKKAK